MTRKDSIITFCRHLTSVITAVSLVGGLLLWFGEPRAIKFVRGVMAEEGFASQKELELQTHALRDLAARFAQQSESLDEQSRQQTALKTDIEAIKDLQRETLRVLLRSERNN